MEKFRVGKCSACGRAHGNMKVIAIIPMPKDIIMLGMHMASAICPIRREEIKFFVINIDGRERIERSEYRKLLKHFGEWI